MKFRIERHFFAGFFALGLAAACTDSPPAAACESCDADAGASGGKADEVLGGGSSAGDDEGAPPRFQPLDLAFLIPPLEGPGPDHIALSSPTASGAPILTPEALESLAVPGGFDPTELASNIHHHEDLYGSMFITGVRVGATPHDVMNEGSGEPSESGAELRLVVQPWRQGSFEDAAIHLVYRIDEADLPAVLGSFWHIKQRCEALIPGATDAPVGIHPCLAGGERAFLRMVRDEVLRHIDFAKLKPTTTMIRNGRFWFFRVFAVGEEAFTPIDMGALVAENGSPLMGLPPCDAGDPQCGAAVIGEPTQGALGFRPVPTASAEGLATRLLADYRESPAEAALVATHLLNPGSSRIADIEGGIGGVDCVSCHIQDDALALMSAGPVPEAAYVPPSAELNCATRPEVDALVPLRTIEGLQLQVINFGYRVGGQGDADIAINPRTVHEACDSAYAINEEVLPEVAIAPPATCDVTVLVRGLGAGETRLVGNADAMGSWSPDAALPMAERGDGLAAEVPLVPGTPYQFKVVRPAEGVGWSWLGGDNVALQFDDEACGSELGFELGGRGL